MKTLVILTALLLTACATATEVKTPYMPSPPTELMTPPIALLEITASSDGTVAVKTAMDVFIQNNGIAKTNAVQLAALEKWITDTQKNIANGGKVK